MIRHVETIPVSFLFLPDFKTIWKHASDMPRQPMHTCSVNMQDIYVWILDQRSTVLDFGQMEGAALSLFGSDFCARRMSTETRWSLAKMQPYSLALPHDCGCCVTQKKTVDFFPMLYNISKCKTLVVLDGVDCSPASLRVFPSRLTVPLWLLEALKNGDTGDLADTLVFPWISEKSCRK